MRNWRDQLLDEFVPDISRVILVADPDGLLTEEYVLAELQKRGFELIEFTDSIECRYVYESRFRSQWDQQVHLDKSVVIRIAGENFSTPPFDFSHAALRLSFDLNNFFPDLSYPVIQKLDRSLLDAVFEAQTREQPRRLGDNATREFLVRHLCSIDPSDLSTDVELLSVLLRLHYGKQALPDELTGWLVEELRRKRVFQEWDLDKIVPDSNAFFTFLQERWPIYLKSLSEERIHEVHPAYGLSYSGPELLPFDHRDVKVYIDTLFLDRKLVPVHVENLSIAPDSWMQVGIVHTRDEDDARRIEQLIERVEQTLPADGARFADWVSFATTWAELSALIHHSGKEIHQEKIKALGNKVNALFAVWLQSHYSGLSSQSSQSPVMVHHILRRLARSLEEQKVSRIALIVMDGLSLAQWVTIRGILLEQDDRLTFRESGVFAWIPTITSVSRQAIFAGKPPYTFPSSIKRTNTEKRQWGAFWQEHQVKEQQIAYKRGLGDGSPSQVLEDVLHPSQTKVLGLVVDKIDKIMHGMQLGAAGMHNQIQQWGRTGFLQGLIEHLLDLGFEVWLTSDHGNIECEGRGRPSEGSIADSRGERMRLYKSEELRDRVAIDFPFALPWQTNGLPPDFFPLVASGRDAFKTPGQTTVTHGGIAIEEVIVPLVQIKRKHHDSSA